MRSYSFCIPHKSGFRIVGQDGKYNLVSSDDSLIFDKWLDNLEEHGRYIMVEREGLYNLVDSNGALVYKDWTNDYKKVEYNGYVIIPVNSSEEAEEIAHTYGFDGVGDTIFSDEEFREQTVNGGYSAYVCINQEYLKTEENEKYKDGRYPTGGIDEYPRDNYGNSVIVVIVNHKGELRHSLCRWEPDIEQYYAGRTTREYTREELTNLIGRKFEEVFKPISTIEQKCKDFMEPFVNGKDLDKNIKLYPFSRVMWYDNREFPEFRKVSVGDKCNLFQTRLAEVKEEYDERFKHNVHISYYEFVNAKNEKVSTPELISTEWFDEIENFRCGFALCKLEDKYNYIGTNRQFLTDTWYDEARNFYDETKWAVVYIKGKGYNFLKTTGEMVSPDIWFDEPQYIGKDEDYVEVTSGDKKYKLYRNGTLELYSRIS